MSPMAKVRPVMFVAPGAARHCRAWVTHSMGSASHATPAVVAGPGLLAVGRSHEFRPREADRFRCGFDWDPGSRSDWGVARARALVRAVDAPSPLVAGSGGRASGTAASSSLG